MEEIPSRHKYLWRCIGVCFLILIVSNFIDTSSDGAMLLLFIMIIVIMVGLVLDERISAPKYNKYTYEQEQEREKYRKLAIQKEKEYLNKYSIPLDTKEIKCTNIDDYSSAKFESIALKIWKSDNKLIIISRDYISDVGKIEIPIDDIKSFKRFGDLHSYTNVTGGGGGGSSLGGAVVGGVIAGGAGAVVGSRKKVEEVKTEHIIEDERQTILEVQGKDRIHYITFKSKDYDVFLKLVPNKEVTFIENKNDKISNTDIYKDIEELSKLKDKGILTEEEFNNKKQDLLSKI